MVVLTGWFSPRRWRCSVRHWVKGEIVNTITQASSTYPMILLALSACSRHRHCSCSSILKKEMMLVPIGFLIALVAGDIQSPRNAGDGANQRASTQFARFVYHSRAGRSLDNLYQYRDGLVMLGRTDCHSGALSIVHQRHRRKGNHLHHEDPSKPMSHGGILLMPGFIFFIYWSRKWR